jgi:hypothetical protein
VPSKSRERDAADDQSTVTVFRHPICTVGCRSRYRDGTGTLRSQESWSHVRAWQEAARDERPDVLAKWTANAALAFIDQYIGNLRRYRAISIDVGDEDRLRDDSGKLHAALDKYGIANSFEIYPGTHPSKLGDRFQNHVLPFFSQHLVFGSPAAK